jgi:microcystin degradation protein MlrC
MPRIAVARLWFEGNSFTPALTTPEAFRAREWLAGPEGLAAAAGTATELGGLVRFLSARPDWEARLIRATSAQPGGPMTRAALEAWLAEAEAGLRDGAPWDGVYLSLHGAAVAEDEPTADLAIIRRIRALVGATPLVASFDFHANMAPEIATLVDGASVYRSYPHIDMAETAERALALLERRLAGTRLHGAIVKLPVVLHSFHMRSAAPGLPPGPMAEVWAEAAALESEAVPEAAPFGGFAWGDTPHAGPCGMAWATEPGAAQAAASRIAAAIAERRPRFAVTLPKPEVALRAALAAPPGLVALLDPADNPLSGGVADTPALLRALLAAGPPVPTVFAFLHDPATVAEAVAAGPGATRRFRLGGRSTEAFGPPVALDAVVERLTPGRFVNAGPMERGMAVDVGPSCVLRVGMLRVIVTSRKEAAVDPGFFDLHGIDLGATRLLANKAKNHFRAAFGERCAAILECDCPGPAALDLAALPFRHVPAAWREGVAC